MRFYIACFLLLLCCVRFNYRHTCPFKHCPFKGYEWYNDQICGCPEGSDCYYLDKLHWQYPSASYDEIDDMLFNPLRKPAPEIISKRYDEQGYIYVLCKEGKDTFAFDAMTEPEFDSIFYNNK